MYTLTRYADATIRRTTGRDIGKRNVGSQCGAHIAAAILPSEAENFVSETSPETFLLKFMLKDGETIGHELDIENRIENEPEASEPSNHIEEEASELKFRFVFEKFSTSMDLYQRFVPITMALAPKIASAIAGGKLTEFARAKGTKRTDLSNKEQDIYELEIAHFREFVVHQNEISAAMETTAQLPRVMIIGLISAYDFHLSQLLRVVINLHEEITLSSEKNIRYADLLKYDSIQQVRTALIDKEVENVIRESHIDQFKWMENHFNMKLRDGLAVFPEFIELCERRNLFTHTGGIVSTQYIANCSEIKANIGTAVIGTRLSVSSAYYNKAVDTVYEIGVKLIYVLWRKFNKSETALADGCFNELCFELIFKGRYKIAETLLSFASSTITKFGGGEGTRCMVVINHANALRLQGQKEQAIKLVENEDWSAAGDEYRLCVAAVREDLNEVSRLMKLVGANGKINIENYRTWPVFRGLRTEKVIAETFFQIFNKPLIDKDALGPEVSANVELRFAQKKGLH